MEVTMLYMMLIYEDEKVEAQRSRVEQEAVLARYAAFTDEVRRRSIFHSGAPLQPTLAATTVRVRQGRIATSDGPYADMPEQLGGFYILDCADLDEAIALAAKIPTAAIGTVEIRPLAELN
jgi:hypothetical protein